MSVRKTRIIFRNRSMEMGGIGTVLLNILNHLDYGKYEVVLLLNYMQGEFLDRVPKEVKIVAVAEGSKNFSNNTFLHTIQKIFRRIKFWKFEKLPTFFYRKHGLNHFDYEVAFSHYMLQDVYNSPNKKSKKIYWIHGDLRNSGFSKLKNQHFVDLMQQFDKGVFVSQHGKDIIEKNWKVTLQNAEIIYNPMEIDEIILRGNEAVENEMKNIDFVSVGRLFHLKGFKDLLEVHAQLIQEGYKIKTAIIGEGIQRNELESLIEKFGVKESFILHGFSENPVKYIKNARFFVLPSYTESYPMVIGEALSLGKPVLSTNVGGIPEMITENENGMLFNPGKENVYATLKKVLDHPEIGDHLSEHDSLALLRAKNNRIFQQIDALFQS